MRKLKYLLLASAFMCSVNSNAQEERISSIGEVITKEIAQNLIKNFEMKNSSTTAKGHFYGSKALQEMLHLKGTAGVYVFRGQDDEGETHLVFKTANENGGVMPDDPFDFSFPCPSYCPKGNISAIGGRINEDLAQQWIYNFQKNNEGKVFAHLFGKEILEQLLLQNETEGIYFANGLDAQGTAQIILSGVNKDGEVLWNGLVANAPLPNPAYYNDYPPRNLAMKK